MWVTNEMVKVGSLGRLYLDSNTACDTLSLLLFTLTRLKVYAKLCHSCSFTLTATVADFSEVGDFC